MELVMLTVISAVLLFNIPHNGNTSVQNWFVSDVAVYSLLVTVLMSQSGTGVSKDLHKM